MDEAARCERLAFLLAGRLIADGTPDEITEHFGLPTLEQVFIDLQARAEAGTEAA
jgi:ABC-type multidrug transport system ATPase subunit